MKDVSKMPSLDNQIETALTALGDNQLTAARRITKLLEGLLEEMKDARPDERGELSRRYAIAITEAEKLLAYCKVYIIGYGQR